jgi:hypothetical protein
MVENHLNQFKKYLIADETQNSNSLTFTAHMKLIDSILFKKDLLTTTSINRLNIYFKILISDKPYFKILPKAKQRELKKAFRTYIEFIQSQKDPGLATINNLLAA